MDAHKPTTHDAMAEALQIPPASAIRDELEKLVLTDLHGPAGGPDEDLDEASVSERYLVGMWAFGNPMDIQTVPGTIKF